MSALQRVFSRQSSAFSLLIFILFIANLFIFTPSAFAADDPCVVKVGNWCPLGGDNYNDEISVQRFTRNVLVSGHVAVGGENPMGGAVYTEHAMIDKQGNLSYVPGLAPGNTNNGALAMTTKTIAALYNPPTSSVEYLANLGENIGLAPKSAYAQTAGIGGSGDNVIAPVLALWQVTRNIAYVGFILVFVTAGVMIMFRQKLNPQTVIGIQQALPGLVIGLILVTFSYFIAALIVDLTFVGTRLVTEIFISTKLPNYYGCDYDVPGAPCNFSADGLNKAYNKSDAFYMYGHAANRMNNISDVFGQIWGSLGPKSNPETNPGKGTGSIIDGIGMVIGLFANGLSAFGQAALALTGATLGAILVPLILMIALMIQFIKLIIALVMSYLQILIMVIFGPFFIMFSAIPGRGGALSTWLKSLLANALVFPAVFAGFLFAGMLLQWNSASLNSSNMPLFGGLSPDILKSVLAFGVLLGLPSIPDMIREAFGVKGPKGFTQAAIGGFMGGINVSKTGYNQAMERKGVRAQQAAKKEDKMQGARGGNQWNGWRGKVRDWMP